MSDTPQEDIEASVTRLNALAAHCASVEATHNRLQSPQTRRVLEGAEKAYEEAVQECWDKGMMPRWDRDKKTFVIE